MAYNNESTTNTTLVEGSVKVSQHNHQMLLAPGEQAQLDKQGALNKTKVNVASVIAWKNGFFNFSHTDFQGAMRQLARWYDVDVNYQSDREMKLTGSLSRKSSLEEVLKLLEKNGAKIILKDRTVTIF